jgi:hypothetical protein
MSDSSDITKKKRAAILAQQYQLQVLNPSLQLVTPGEIALLKTYDYICNPPCDTAGSLSFAGTTPAYLLTANTADFTIGTRDFTIEWWQRLENGYRWPRPFAIGNYLTNEVIALSLETDPTNYLVRSLYLIQNGVKYYYGDFGGASATLPLATVVNTWCHFAIVGRNRTATIYVNGTPFLGSGHGETQLTSYNFVNNTGTYPFLSLGGGFPVYTDSIYKGAIKGFRWTLNNALYTAAFTPTRSALPSLTGTKLLLNTNLSQPYNDTSTFQRNTIVTKDTVTWQQVSP